MHVTARSAIYIAAMSNLNNGDDLSFIVHVVWDPLGALGRRSGHQRQPGNVSEVLDIERPECGPPHESARGDGEVHLPPSAPRKLLIQSGCEMRLVGAEGKSVPGGE